MAEAQLRCEPRDRGMGAAPAARGVIVAAPASGTGKTLAACGLIVALRRRGHRVAALKVGPDYIDPRFLKAAAGRAAPNLDLWAMREGFARRILTAEAAQTDFLVVEGVMGLFDGAAGGGGATADVARWAGLPVLLVVDGSRQSQSIAALVHGFSSFDPTVEVAGLILTKVAGDRHEQLLREALARPGLPAVLACLRSSPGLRLGSRHLGLVQAMEIAALESVFARAAACFDAAALDRIEARARPAAFADTAPPDARAPPPAPLPPLGQQIAIAHDAAFGFAYPHLLAGWRQAGATLRLFSPLAGEPPGPDVDAVFLPGGYPELHAARLAAAGRFMAGLRAHAEAGTLIYGECGGYMVLGEALIDGDGGRHPMAGLLGLVSSMSERRLTLGYRALRHSGPLPWPASLRGHEFHYSVEIEEPVDTGGAGRGRPAESALFAAADSAGAGLGAIGRVRGRVMGSYAHVVDAAAP